MAHEPHDSPHGEAGFGGNADGVLKEQQHRPRMGEKMKNTLANMTAKMRSPKGEHASHPGSRHQQDDPQMYVGHPSVVYGKNGSAWKSEAENAHRHRSLSPHSPRSPRVAVGHNPEYEPVGVGEQSADTVMPGHHVDHLPDPLSPHQQSISEKLLEKIPGYSQNPYKHGDHVPVGAPLDGHEHHHLPSPLRDPQRQHVVGEPEIGNLGEDHVENGDKRPGFIGKLKDLVTGQKPGQGAGAGYATIDQTADTKDELSVDEKPGNRENLPQPTPGGDRFRDATEKIRAGGHQSQQVWPSPAKADYHNMPGAVRTDDQGKPIEGPKEEGKSPKSEGVMSKIMEKLHIGQQKPAAASPAASPRSATDATSKQ